MDDRDWLQAKELFKAALELPEADRAAYLKQSSDDQAVIDEVQRLLKSHGSKSDFLCSPLAAPSADDVDPLIGRQIGDFQILRKIGSGGMGIVYEARQDNPSRRAAVKVLRVGLASREMLRRFEFESQVLGRLQHSGIAHIYASGSADLGGGPQPWFAMEYIEGAALDRYVKAANLSTHGKLELLARVCDAVQHAHQRGVVHRDLKPSNILVHDAREQGSPGQVKVLDFGVARAIDADIQTSLHTVVGELVGTLNYMSPEQLRGRPDEIDARTDVYSLGIIGYEMLSGGLPHGQRGGNLPEVVRAIEQSETKKLGSIAPALRGDIETIFSKALEKDAARRYQSVADFAADIRRFLTDEPIVARPPTAVYQFRKFARRNRVLLGGVVATMLALIAGTVTSLVQARAARLEAARSRYEADKAGAINNFMTNDFLMKLLASANAVDSGKRLPAAELVEKSAEKIGVMFADQPSTEAAVRNEVATIYYNLGAFEKAADQFNMAMEKWSGALGKEHADTLKAVNNLGLTLLHLRRRDEAEALLQRALDGRMRLLGEDDPYTLMTMNNLAELYRQSDKTDEAEAMMRRTLAIQERVHGRTHKNTLTSLGNLGSLLAAKGKLEQALPMHREVYESCRQTLGTDHVMTQVAGARLGLTLNSAGKAEEAEPLMAAVVESLQRSLGPSHASTISARRTFSKVLTSLGRKEESKNQLQLALDGARAAADRPEARIRELEREIKALDDPRK